MTLSMSNVHFIGIDPGAKGAIATIYPDGTVTIIDMPTEDVVYCNSIISEVQSRFEGDGDYNNCVFMENVHALPRQSTVAGFTFGKNVGKAELYATSMLCYPGDKLIKVTPQKWKKFFNLTKDKKESILLAKELFPSVAHLLTASKDGRAEALLIAEYGRRNYDNYL